MKQSSQLETTAIPIIHINRLRIKLTKLLKVDETGSLLGFEYNLFLNSCFPFLSRESVNSKDPYSLEMLLAMLQTLLKLQLHNTVIKIVHKKLNKILISHQSDKCANECQLFDTKH
jgi:hypothetical protein